MSRTDRGKMKAEQFLEGAGAINRDLQQQQHEFEATQSHKYQEWAEKTEQEGNEFNTALQLQSRAHQQKMAEDNQKHLQQLSQDNMMLGKYPACIHTTHNQDRWISL